MQLLLQIPPEWPTYKVDMPTKVVVDVIYVGLRGMTCQTVEGNTFPLMYKDTIVFPQIAKAFIKIYPELFI